MKKLNVIITLGVACIMSQAYGKIPQNQQNRWKAGISKIITDEAVNANGKIIDQDVIDKLIDYNMGVMKSTKAADKKAVQTLLDTIRAQRLKEIKAAKSKVAVELLPMDSWKADISNIITDDAVNANGKIIDQDVVNKLIDYNISILNNTKPADKDAVQASLDTIRNQRLQEIRAAKQ